MKRTGKVYRIGIFALMLVLALLTLCPAALATATLPNLPSGQYVVDDANILSDSTAQVVEDWSAQLESSCDGAQIGVLTVQSTGNVSTEEYALQAFNAWGIGSSDKNNGAMLLLVLECEDYPDGDYYLTTGTAFHNTRLETNANEISQTMETAFAAKDYDTAVLTGVENVANEIADIYGVTLDSSSGTDTGSDQPGAVPEQPQREKGSVFFTMIGYLFEAILVIAIFIVILRAIFAPIGRARGWSWGPFAWGWFMDSRRPRGPRHPRPPRNDFGPGPGMGGGARPPRGGMGGGRPMGGGMGGRPMGGGRSMGGGGGRGRSGGMGGGRSGGGRSGGGMGGGRSMGGGGGRGR